MGKMKFGKYKGQPYEAVPADYMLWVADSVENLEPELEAYIDENLEALNAEQQDQLRDEPYRTSHYEPY